MSVGGQEGRVGVWVEKVLRKQERLRFLTKTQGITNIKPVR